MRLPWFKICRIWFIHINRSSPRSGPSIFPITELSRFLLLRLNHVFLQIVKNCPWISKVRVHNHLSIWFSNLHFFCSLRRYLQTFRHIPSIPAPLIPDRHLLDSRKPSSRYSELPAMGIPATALYDEADLPLTNVVYSVTTPPHVAFVQLCHYPRHLPLSTNWLLGIWKERGGSRSPCWTIMIVDYPWWWRRLWLILHLELWIFSWWGAERKSGEKCVVVRLIDGREERVNNERIDLGYICTMPPNYYDCRSNQNCVIVSCRYPTLGVANYSGFESTFLHDCAKLA